jgi:hypothetical protein
LLELWVDRLTTLDSTTLNLSNMAKPGRKWTTVGLMLDLIADGCSPTFFPLVGTSAYPLLGHGPDKLSDVKIVGYLTLLQFTDEPYFLRGNHYSVKPMSVCFV